MDKFTDKPVVFLEYDCIALPPDDIIMGEKYEFGNENGRYFYVVKGEKIYADIEFIQMLFKPIKTTWVKVLGK